MSSPEITLLLERLDRIEAALALALTAPQAVRSKPVVATRYLTTDEAREVLRCSRTTLEGHAARGLCSQVRPKGRGRGKPVRYVREEVETLAVSEEAARELMSRKKGRGKTS